MEQRIDHSQLERVFSDAHVVDLDFSQWDKFVALWVLADHWQEWTDSCPLLVVEFFDVREILIKFRHPAVQLENPKHHVQWNIDDFRIQEGIESVSLELFEGQRSPRLKMEFGSICIRQVSQEVLHRNFPGWNRPYSGLARPGIEEIFARDKGGSRKR